MPEEHVFGPIQVFSVVVPSISIVGNALIVYVSIRSKELRRPCNVFIALVSLGDILHMLGHYVTIGSSNLVEEHVIRQDICVYLQMGPIFGLIISVFLLLSVAIDRVLSLTSFYNFLLQNYMRLYLAVQIVPSCALGVAMDFWIYEDRKSDQSIFCAVAAPMGGAKYSVLNRLFIINGILIIACYTFFVVYMRKIRLKGANVKRIYKSVILASMVVVFGFFIAMVIMSVGTALGADGTILRQTSLLFITSATAVNFFVYYMTSSQYRQMFDEFLGIGRLKRIGCFSGKRSNRGTNVIHLKTIANTNY